MLFARISPRWMISGLAEGLHKQSELLRSACISQNMQVRISMKSQSRKMQKKKSSESKRRKSRFLPKKQKKSPPQTSWWPLEQSAQSAAGTLTIKPCRQPWLRSEDRKQPWHLLKKFSKKKMCMFFDQAVSKHFQNPLVVTGDFFPM